MLLYYEDLISSPNAVCRQILDFLDEEDTHLKSTLKNLDLIKTKILAGYQKIGSNKAQYSGGKDPIYHSKNFSLREMHIVDCYLKQHYPILWEKYLKRYKTKI